MDRLVKMPPAPPGYPKELERTARLRDNTPVFVRPIRPDDAPRLIDGYSRLSKHTAYQRFFTLRRRLPADWARSLASVDYQRRMALIAERETVDEPELIGVGRYVVLRAAQSRGLRRFRAFVLADNKRMLTLLSRHTDIKQREIEDGVVVVTLEPRDTAT
jgi:hypothetical protein